MGSYLQKPVVEKNTDSGETTNYKWASTGMQGWRTSMEDSHIHQVNFPFFEFFQNLNIKILQKKTKRNRQKSNLLPE